MVSKQGNPPYRCCEDYLESAQRNLPMPARAANFAAVRTQRILVLTTAFIGEILGKRRANVGERSRRNAGASMQRGLYITAIELPGSRRLALISRDQQKMEDHLRQCESGNCQYLPGPHQDNPSNWISANVIHDPRGRGRRLINEEHSEAMCQSGE